MDETALPGELPQQLCARLSRAKTDTVATGQPAGLVIGSDQVAMASGVILGKPGTHALALQQLRALRGGTCLFLTGLHVLNIASGRRYASIHRTTVRFRQTTDDELERYLHFDQPYDCAGSFKSEAAGVGLQQWQRGADPSALVGLPLMRLAQILCSEGVALFGTRPAEPPNLSAPPTG